MSTPAPKISSGLPSPVDIRLLPALLLSLGTAITVDRVPAVWIWLIAPVLLLLAVLGCSLMLLQRARSHHQRSPQVATWCGILVVACCIAAAVGASAAAQRDVRIATGWEEAVVQDVPSRISVVLTGEVTQNDSPFGPQWSVAAEAHAYGHPLTGMDAPVGVVLTSSSALDGVVTGDELCVVADLNASESTVFARARQQPHAGQCSEQVGAGQGTGGYEQSGATGRDRIRTALRSQSVPTVGTAPQLLPGLILGDRTAQSPELDEAMKAAGLSHLSAVSGANCSLVAGVVTLLLRSARLPRSVVLTAVLGVLVLFVDVVGWEPSVVRAATMGAIGAWAVFFGRGRHALPVLCLAACVLLCLSPSLAVEPAFQLSLAATAGIVLGARPLEERLSRLLRTVLPESVATVLAAAIAISTTAQLACQPVLLTITGTVNIYAIPANLLAAPLVPLITVPGTFAAFIAVILPPISGLILWVIGLPAAGIGAIAQWVADWPGALVTWPEGPLGTVVSALHVAALSAAIFLLLSRERQGPPTVRMVRPVPPQTGRPSRRLVHLILVSSLVGTALTAQLAVLIPHRPGEIAQDWLIAACDVGQGDMFLIRTGESSAIVVDTGPEDDAAARCLRTTGVTQIPLLVITHLHADHVGGTAAIVDLAKPEHTLYSTADETSDSSLSVSAVHLANATTETQPDSRLPTEAERAEAGMNGEVHASLDGEEATVRWTVLEALQSAPSENDASVQFQVEIMYSDQSVDVLFTGDMEAETTRELLGRNVYPDQVDVLNIGHHGAINGGTQLIDAMDPQLAMIGVGEDNNYGHPHPDIVRHLRRFGPVVRTDLHGTSTVSIRDEQLVSTTSR